MHGYKSNNGRYIFVGTEDEEYTFDSDGEPLHEDEDKIPTRALEVARGVAEEA